jgi:Na+/proline symporter
MHPADWVVVLSYVAGVALLGAWLARRAGRSAEDYLVAGRRLRWWVIGFSDVASADGADAFWVYAVFTGAFMSFFRIWWVGAIVAMPIAILWARYWRRMRLVSSGELFEVRYGGRAAGRFRGAYAVWIACVASSIVLAYVLRGFSQIMAPFFGWTVEEVLLVFAGTSMAYTMMAGLFGVSYSDVPQFVLVMLARVALAVIVLDVAGGPDAVVATVTEARGADFLRPYPPSPAGAEGVYGAFDVDPGSLVALMMGGLFSVAGASSLGAQRALAARSEWDAAAGRALSVVLSLGVRTTPLLIIGLCAVALYPDAEEATEVWAQLVREHAPPGLLGLILVGVVAGYMSTIDSYINFMTAALTNDLFRRHLAPEASPKSQVRFGRLATALVTLIAWLWATVLFEKIDADWLNFINSVIGLFVLPLALLRWCWWRMNIWGEVAGFLGGFPLAYVVWFTLGFKDEPYWQAFLVLFSVGAVVVLTVTLLTPPEKPDVLKAFYRQVRPPGAWGPIARAVEAETHDAVRSHAERRYDLLSVLLGFPFCASLVVSVSAGVSGQWSVLAISGTLCAICGAGFLAMQYRAAQVRERVPEQARLP